MKGRNKPVHNARKKARETALKEKERTENGKTEMEKERKQMTTKATLLKAIRSQCLECVCQSSIEVEKCSSPGCSVSIRLGRDPAPARKGNPSPFQKSQALGHRICDEDQRSGLGL